MVKKEELNQLANSYILKNPLTMYQIKEEKFDNLFERLINNYKNIIKNNENRLSFLINNLQNNIVNNLNDKKNKYIHIISKLEVLNPLLTIKRGYSIVKKEGKVVTSIKKIKKKDHVQVDFADGTVDMEVL